MQTLLCNPRATRLLEQLCSGGRVPHALLGSSVSGSAAVMPGVVKRVYVLLHLPLSSTIFPSESRCSAQARMVAASEEALSGRCS